MRPLVMITALLMGASLWGCQKLPEKEEEIKTEKDVAKFLDRLEKGYETSCIRMGQATWNLYSGEGGADLNSVRAEFADIFLNSVYRKIVTHWRYSADKEIDGELKRRLDVWSQSFLGAYVEEDEEIYTLETSLEERNHQFPFSMDGRVISRAELNRIVRTDPDPERRRRAWEAFGLLSEAMESDLLRLMRKRNENVELLGRQIDYGTFSLMVQAINAGWLRGLIDRLEERTRQPYREFVNSLREGLGMKTLRPWDIQYAMRQAASLPDEYFPRDRALPTLFEFVRAIGFQADKLPIRIVEGHTPFGCLGLAVRIPSDFRLLVNLSQGHRFYSALFHEYGRGLYAVHIQAELPILKGYDWVLGASSSAYTEGMAEVMAEFTRDPLWLKKYTHLPEEQIELYASARARLELYTIRSLMSTISFELRAYENLEQNLDRLQKELERKFLLVDTPEDTPSRWASMTSLVTSPIYYQNYLLAAVVSAQIHQALKEQFGDRMIDSPEVGRWLIENLYTPGETLPWRERIRQATGNWPDIDAYVDRLVGATTAAWWR